MKKHMQHFPSLVIILTSIMVLGGCRTDFNTRALQGRAANNFLYEQFGQQFGGASYDANIGVYLVYNATTRTSGRPNPQTGNVGDGLGPVNPVGGGNTPPTQVPSNTGPVTPRGNGFSTGGTQQCMVRKFEIPQNGNNFYTRQFTNTGIARAIGQTQCHPDSQLAVSARGAYVTNTNGGNQITFYSMSLTGGTLIPRYMNMAGSIGAIDAGDTEYVVASVDRNGNGIHDHLVVIREAFTDRMGVAVPAPEYEVQIPNHDIVDLTIDENHGMLYIATRTSGYGKIIAYSLSDTDAFAQDSLLGMLQRTNNVFPANTFLRNGGFGQQGGLNMFGNQNVMGFDDGLGNSVFVTSANFDKIANFDGLTASLLKDGRIFVIEDLYGDSIAPEDRQAYEQQSGQFVSDEWEYLGTRSGFLGASVRNSANPYNLPSTFAQSFTDVEVGNNIFYALADQSIYYFMGDTSLLLNSGVPRSRQLLMGNLNTIDLNNQEQISLITSDQGVKVCHVYGGSFNCGPSSTADLSEENQSLILDGKIMPNTWTIDPGALPTNEDVVENPNDAQDPWTDEDNG